MSKTTGLHVTSDVSFIGTFPVLIECQCCGKCLLEIKCPYEYKTRLKDWDNKTFPMNADSIIKTNHKYYSQIQSQMLFSNTMSNVSFRLILLQFVYMDTHKK